MHLGEGNTEVPKPSFPDVFGAPVAINVHSPPRSSIINQVDSQECAFYALVVSWIGGPEGNDCSFVTCRVRIFGINRDRPKL